jgi:putative membrane protein
MAWLVRRSKIRRVAGQRAGDGVAVRFEEGTMAEHGGNEPHVKPSVVKERESHFSWLRTRMSVERTMLSWIRTGTAMIGFGFTIYQFFERFNDMPGVTPARHPGTVRTVALALIIIGTTAVLVAIAQYRGMVRYLWSEEFRDIAGVGDTAKATPTLMVAVLLVLVGVLTIGVILIRAPAPVK